MHGLNNYGIQYVLISLMYIQVFVNCGSLQTLTAQVECKVQYNGKFLQ